MAVIQRANDEQAQALAKQDASLMRDTATAPYYTELAQTQVDLENGGVTSIKILTLQWGAVNVQGTNAQATTTETWQTNYADGGAEQSTDLNAYALVKQGSTWLIASDDHPDTGVRQPAPTSGSNSGTAAAPPAASGTDQSRNWAGYAATGGTFTSVSGSWTVPQVTAGSSTGSADATWVGIGGVQSDDLIQAGTEATVMGSGQVRYSAWIELLPRPSQTVPLSVSPGDVIAVSLAQQANGSWQISFVNQTTAQRYQTTVQYASSLSSAEWIEEAPATGSFGQRIVTLDNFGQVQVTGATAVEDGRQVTVAKAGGSPTAMYGRGGQPLARPSALGADGSSFTVTRVGGGSVTNGGVRS